MQIPTVSVAVLVGVLMLQLAPSISVEGCSHPGGCVSCGYRTSFTAVIKADDRNVAATLSEYTESALDSGRGIRDYGDGTLWAGATFKECNEVAQVLRDVMGWGTGTSILGCGYNSLGPFGYLVMGACDTALSQIQELVNTVYCLNKPNGCVSCPAGASGLPQADDRALAALTDIVTPKMTGKPAAVKVFSKFTKGASAQGGPGIFAEGGDAQCQEGRKILVEKLTAIDADFELGCSAPSNSQSLAPGFLKGCSNPATIGILQALIDEHAIGATTAATITTAAAATTTVPAVCNQEPKAGDGEITCSGGPQQSCISVDGEALHTINCLLAGEGVAPVTVESSTGTFEGCITTSSDAHCQAVTAYFYTHVQDGGQACNGDCTLHCRGKGFLVSEDCGGRGRQYLKDMVEAYNRKTRPIVLITLSTDFSDLYFSAPNILDAGCEDNADTSPSTIAMTAFFLGQGLDVYVRCNGNENLELYMTGKDKDKAAKAMDSFHRKIPGNNGPVRGESYHIAFNVEGFVITNRELGSVAGGNLATNIQEVLKSFATTANAAASLTTTTTTTTTAATATTATAASSTDTPSCIRGEYMKGANFCTPCPANTYQSSSKHRQKSCTPQPTCGAGQKISADSKIAAQTCSSCAAGTYQDSTSHRQTSCAPQPTCNAETLINASATIRGVCVSTITTSATTTTTIAVKDKDGGTNSGAGQPEDTNDDSNNDNNNGDGEPPGGTTTTTNESSNTTKDSGVSVIDDSDNVTANGNKSAPPTVPQQSASSSTSTIVGVLAALIVVIAVVGFILWRQKLSTGAAGGIPHVGDQNGGGGGGVPPIYHNRMYNIGTSAPSEACLQPGALQSTVYGSQPGRRSTVSATEAGVVYAIPVDLQDEGGTDINGYATPLANYAVVGAGGGGGGTPNGGGTDINGYATPLANYAVVGAGGGGGTPNGGGNHDYAIPEARSRANPLLPLDLDGYVVDDAAPAGGGASGGPVYATPAANSSDI